ncbi:MATE family efflux transporter [Avibacterium volantium]|uniref:MATE family efflux transporter n=1 Tax=Avibacterium TaxID=292486 RepID=UPI003BF88E7B
MLFSFIQHHRQEMGKLVAIAFPILLAQMAQNSMGFVDTIMAGRVSAADMAAISVGASIWLPLILLGHGLLLALPPIISYLNGSGQRQRIAHYVRQGMWVVVLSCIPLGLFIYYSDYVISHMKMEPRLAQITIDYLHAMLWGLPGYLLMINFRCLNDGIAKTAPTMLITFAGLFLNIPLNYIFIYGKLGVPAFGAVGCGIATAIVNWAMCFMMISYSRQARSQRDIHLFDKIIEKPDFSTLKKVLGLGFPIGIALFCEVALFALSSLLLSPLGTDVVASHQVALTTSSFIFTFPISLGMATTILVGQRLGEGQLKQAKVVFHSALAVGLALACITASIIVLFNQQIPKIYVTDKQVILIASHLLLISALYQFSDTIQVITAGALRGYKDTKSILYITMFCYWGIGMPLGYILSRTDWLMPSIGAAGFWVGFVVSLTVAAVLLIQRIRKIQALPDQEILQKLKEIQ